MSDSNWRCGPLTAGRHFFIVLYHTFKGYNTIKNLRRNGGAITEGWKGALAICYTNMNCFAINGCHGLPALLRYLEDNNLEASHIKNIFADSDVLWNPIVNDAYYKMQKALPNASIYVYPPKTFITESGALNYTKDSPDDWIQEGDTEETVFTHVYKVDIEQVSQQLDDTKHKYYKISASSSYSVTHKTQEKIQMNYALKEFFSENVYFNPKINLYYVFDSETHLWSTMDLEELAYFCLKGF